MKKLNILYIIAATVLLNACSKDITESNMDFPALQPASLDINAGTWKPILLTGPTEFPVAAPIATGTPDYIAQVNEIKSFQAKMTNEEKKAQNHDSKGRSALTSKELQMLFTEPSPRHYTSEMIVAKLNYAGDGASRNAKTEALLKGEIEPGPEARKLVDSLESRMGRTYIDESLAATRHFPQSPKTAKKEIQNKNNF